MMALLIFQIVLRGSTPFDRVAVSRNRKDTVALGKTERSIPSTEQSEHGVNDNAR